MKKLLLSIFFLCVLHGNAQCWEKIATGGSHMLAIKEDGTLWAWGANYTGQLGLGHNENVFVPVQVGTDNNWIAIGAGESFSAAIKSDGTMWTWGNNADQQLGNGTSIETNIPAQMGNDTDWAMVSCGLLHSLALKTDGALWAWGDNMQAQLGGGPELASETNEIVQVSNDTDWKEIKAGYFHNIAIKEDGTMWIWGSNQYGRLGGYFPADQLRQDTIVQFGTDSDWKTASPGYASTAAIKTDGTLWGWGSNYNGEIGDGTNTDRPYPVQVGTDSWIEVSSGLLSTVRAIREDGLVFSWGDNLDGELGIGYGPEETAPVQIESDKTFLAVAGGGYFSAGITTDNELYTWGRSDSGQLGREVTEEFDARLPFIVSCGTTAGLDDNSLRVAFYPNPVVTMIYFEGIITDNLAILDITGKTILATTGNTTQIDVQHLPAGMYFLQVNSNESTFQYKFIKE